MISLLSDELARISLLGPSGASRESERVQVPQRPRKPFPNVYTRPLRKDFELNLPYHQQKITYLQNCKPFPAVYTQTLPCKELSFPIVNIKINYWQNQALAGLRPASLEWVVGQ